jgi:hypothetical protein
MAHNTSLYSAMVASGEEELHVCHAKNSIGDRSCIFVLGIGR